MWKENGQEQKRNNTLDKVKFRLRVLCFKEIMLVMTQEQKQAK